MNTHIHIFKHFITKIQLFQKKYFTFFVYDILI